MSKKILLISAIILVLTVVLTACKGKNYDKTEESTDKVVQTVTVTSKDGGVTTVEIYEDTSGDQYITNVDGEKVPLTTDSEGFYEDIGYIVTSKPSTSNNTSANNSTAGTQSPTSGNATPSSSNGNTTPSSSNGNTVPSSSNENTVPSSSNENTTPSTAEHTTGKIVIESSVKQDSISWDEIKNPKK